MDKDGEFPQIFHRLLHLRHCLRHCRHGRPLWRRHLRGAWRHRCHLRCLRRLHHRRHVGGRSQARPCAKGSKGGRGVEGGNVMDVAGTWESQLVNQGLKRHLEPFRGTRMWGWQVLRHLRKMHSSNHHPKNDWNEIYLKSFWKIHSGYPSKDIKPLLCLIKYSHKFSLLNLLTHHAVEPIIGDGDACAFQRSAGGCRFDQQKTGEFSQQRLGFKWL